jgi:HAD superfamily hydrolase (TIGR01484 family)
VNTRIAKLLVTDFDGTLLGMPEDHLSYEAFAYRIKRFQSNGGVWTVATGRSMSGFKRYFYPLSQYGITPDHLICRNAYIYSWTGLRYRSRWKWNIHIRSLIQQEQRRRAAFLQRLRSELPGRYPDLKLNTTRDDLLSLRLGNHRETMVVAEEIRALIRQAASLMVFEYFQELEVRTVPFTKGMAVRELGAHLQIGPEDVMTIGDGHNDISMLSESISAKAACPANASIEVLDVVHFRQGHISTKKGLAGVIDAMECYDEGGQICSDRPEEAILSQARVRKGKPGRSSKGLDRRHRRFRRFKRNAAIGVIVYLTLLVVASFGILPYGDYFTRPLHVVIDFIAGLFS